MTLADVWVTMDDVWPMQPGGVLYHINLPTLSGRQELRILAVFSPTKQCIIVTIPRFQQHMADQE